MKHEFVASHVQSLVSDTDTYVQFKVHPQHRHYIREILSDVNGDLRVTFKTNKETRSLRQNNLLWKLITTISDEVNGSHTESELMALYRGFIREANIKYHMIATPPETIDFLKEQFRALEVVGDTKTERGNSLVTVKLYPGSSQFDTQEMSQFIEVILRHAGELGIETADVVELRGMR